MVSKYLALACLSLAAAWAPAHVAPRRAVALGAGFGTPKKSAPKKSSAAGLTNDQGWVEMLGGEPVSTTAQALGKSMTGKPYLLVRAPDGGVIASSVDCGRCEFPLLSSKIEAAADGVVEQGCDMCGAKYELSTGLARPSEGGGNKLLAPLLRNKPQRNLASYPVKELADGRVFVNFNKKTFD